MFENIAFQRYTEKYNFVKVNSPDQDTFIVTADWKYLLTEAKSTDNTRKEFITL